MCSVSSDEVCYSPSGKKCVDVVVEDGALAGTTLSLGFVLQDTGALSWSTRE